MNGKYIFLKILGCFKLNDFWNLKEEIIYFRQFSLCSFSYIWRFLLATKKRKKKNQQQKQQPKAELSTDSVYSPYLLTTIQLV